MGECARQEEYEKFALASRELNFPTLAPGKRKSVRDLQINPKPQES